MRELRLMYVGSLPMMVLVLLASVLPKGLFNAMVMGGFAFWLGAFVTAVQRGRETDAFVVLKGIAATGAFVFLAAFHGMMNMNMREVAGLKAVLHFGLPVVLAGLLVPPLMLYLKRTLGNIAPS